MEDAGQERPQQHPGLLPFHIPQATGYTQNVALTLRHLVQSTNNMRREQKRSGE